MDEFVRTSKSKHETELMTQFITPKDSTQEEPKSPNPKSRPEKPQKQTGLPAHQNADFKQELMEEFQSSKQILGSNEGQEIKSQRPNVEMKVHDIEEPKSPNPKPKSAKQKKQTDLPAHQNIGNESYLMEEFQNSEQILRSNERQEIKSLRANVEMKAQNIETGVLSETELLNKMFKRKMEMSNPIRAQKMEDLVNSSNQRIEEALQKGQIEGNMNQKKRGMHKSKDDLKEVDKYRLLEIKNGEIKDKIGDLKSQLEEDYQLKKAQHRHKKVKESDYRMENPRTKQASHFVRELQKKRRSEAQSLAERRLRRHNDQQLQRSKILEEQERENIMKKKKLEQIHTEKQKKRQQDEEEGLKKKSQIAQWSKVFQQKKPLHIRKQEEYFEKNVIPEIYKREEVLIQRKLEKQPIDFNQIEAHDEKYMEYKRDDEMRKQIQIEEIRANERELAEEQTKFFRGKYRSMAQSDIKAAKSRLKEDPTQVERIRKARQIVYGDYIRQIHTEKFKDKSYEIKENQKKKFNRRVRNVRGSLVMESSTEPHSPQALTQASHRSDPKGDGDKNLHYIRELVRQRGIKQGHNEPVSVSEERKAYPNYIQEMREQKKNVSHFKNLSPFDDEEGENRRRAGVGAGDARSRAYDEEHKGSKNKIDSLRINAESLDEKVNRWAIKKKHQLVGQVDQQKDQLMEQQQLKAIKMKMKLLSRID